MLPTHFFRRIQSTRPTIKRTRAQKEIRTMKQLYHPNVVRNLCSFVAGHELWLVMPLLEVGSCASVMGKHHKHGLKNEDLIGSIMYEVLLGLEYLHKDNRIHRDIKAGNILLSKRGTVQIADFGVSGSFQDRQDRKKTFVGTPCWMAPEVLDQVGYINGRMPLFQSMYYLVFHSCGFCCLMSSIFVSFFFASLPQTGTDEHGNAKQGYDSKADIWSFGITALELAFGHPPNSNHQPMKVLMMTLQDPPPTCDSYKDQSYEFSSAFKEMVAECLQKDPARRPTAKDLLRHDFFDRHAKGAAYIEATLTSKLPNLADQCDLGKPITRGRSVLDGGVAPTNDAMRPTAVVDSWVFPDKDELKRVGGMAGLMREQERAAAAAQDLGYADDEDEAPAQPAAAVAQPAAATVTAGRFSIDSAPVTNVGRFSVTEEDASVAAAAAAAVAAAPLPLVAAPSRRMFTVEESPEQEQPVVAENSNYASSFSDAVAAAKAVLAAGSNSSSSAASEPARKTVAFAGPAESATSSAAAASDATEKRARSQSVGRFEINESDS